MDDLRSETVEMDSGELRDFMGMVGTRDVDHGTSVFRQDACLSLLRIGAFLCLVWCIYQAYMHSALVHVS